MIELELSRMAHGGEAVGHYEGKAIFVPYAIPGELVRAEIVQDKGRYARARLLDIVRPSPERVTPRCPHAPPNGQCGGCHWQHIAYEAQLRFKANTVREQLQRLGGLADPPPVTTLRAPSAWLYRNHAEFSFTPEGHVGFFDPAGRRVTPIRQCHLLEPALAELFQAMTLDMPELTRLGLRKGSADDDIMLILETQDDQPPGLETDLPLSACLLTKDGQLVQFLGRAQITYCVLRIAYHVSPPTFFQVNTAQAERLVSLVSEFLDLSGGETVLDAYCGAGLFTAAVAARAAHVVGIEASPWACRDFEQNLAGADNVTLIEAEVGHALPELADRFEAVVLDPPRGGCEGGVIEALIAKAPRRIVFVSCDPATLARDLKRLLQAGYQLERLAALDMFPQTFHVETCVKLVR
ncbi:MAG: class I SAM-dependent RNA methyltransferase [Thermoflexales bacterium]|nr:class I SAM-dependent RNA methyltransferase [Thermoflexales bacterium]